METYNYFDLNMLTKCVVSLKELNSNVWIRAIFRCVDKLTHPHPTYISKERHLVERERINIHYLEYTDPLYVEFS